MDEGAIVVRICGLMSIFKTRGYVLATTLKYCREGIHPSRRKKVLDRISAATVHTVETAQSSTWYTLEQEAEMLNAIAEASDGDAKIAEEDLIGSGVFAGAEATNTFLRLVMKVLTPALFAKKIPELYQRDNNKGNVRVDVLDEKFIGHFTDTSGFPHLAPMSAGWMRFALTSMGKEITSTKISNWTVQSADVPEFTIEMTWK